MSWRYLGDETITNPSTATALSPPAGTQLALIQPHNANVRVRGGTSKPTTSAGLLVTAGSLLNYHGDAADLKLLNAGGTATVFCSYLG